MNTIKEIKEIAARPLASDAVVKRLQGNVQVAKLQEKTTTGGKPYYEVILADGTGDMKLKVWNNMAAFGFCHRIKEGDFISVTGAFRSGEFGVEGEWVGEPLTDPESIALVLFGSAERKAKLDADYADILSLVDSIRTVSLKKLCLAFLQKYGVPFQRAAAARGNHHARRGGLAEHVAGMMRAADALCVAYPEINRSLLISGVLFHDSGKLSENQYEPDGFVMPFSQLAELFGHIEIGAGLMKKLWTDLRSDYPPSDAREKEEQDRIYMHLAHLIFSHHGTKEWGSPVEPRTPEAQLLHFIDNIDAKLEMFREGYGTKPQIGDGVHEKVWALGVNLVQPLAETE